MKHLSSLFAASLCAASLAFNSAHAAVTTVTPGELTVGMEISYPPFESYDKDGKIVGFDPEMSALLANEMGLKATFKDIKFTNLILSIQGGKIDTVISGMYIIPKRLKQADAIPYGKTGALIMVKKDSGLSAKTVDDLCGYTVGLESGTTWVAALQKHSIEYCEANGKGAITVKEFPSAPEASQALLSGNVQAQLEIAGAAHMFSKRTQGRIEISSPELVYPQTLGIYVKKGNTELLNALKQALIKASEDGSYQKLMKKYDLEAIDASEWQS